MWSLKPHTRFSNEPLELFGELNDKIKHSTNKTPKYIKNPPEKIETIVLANDTANKIIAHILWCQPTALA